MPWFQLKKSYFILRLASAGHQVTVFETSTNLIPRNLGPNVTLIHLYVPTESGMAGNLAKLMFTKVYRSYNMPFVYALNNAMTKKFILDFPEQV
jgi:hypothetical protein